MASNAKLPNSKQKSLPVRLSANVGVVATGTIGATAPKFLLLGNGVEVSRALLSCAEVNSVKISRSIYSQLEKSPDFQFLSTEPDWITCGGTDIEAFVLTGRNVESIPVSSDTSVDSGVDVDRPVPALSAFTWQSKTKFAPPSDPEVGNVKSTNKSTAKVEKPPAFYVHKEDRSSSKRQLKGNQRILKSASGTSSNLKQSKRRDTRNGLDSRKSNKADYPKNQMNSLPLSRISENSDDDEVADSDMDNGYEHSSVPSRISDLPINAEHSHSSLTRDKNASQRTRSFCDSSQSELKGPGKLFTEKQTIQTSISSLHDQSADVVGKIVSNVTAREATSSPQRKIKKGISFSEHPVFANTDLIDVDDEEEEEHEEEEEEEADVNNSSDSGTELEHQDNDVHRFQNGDIFASQSSRHDSHREANGSASLPLGREGSDVNSAVEGGVERPRQKQRSIIPARSVRDNRVHPR